MNRFFEYITNHPFLVAAAALLAIVAFVMEFRHRSGGAVMVAPNDAVRLANSGAVILDVRGAAEFQAGHIIDARHVPADDLAARADSLKKYKDKPVLVCCESGMASASAVRALKGLGFTKVAALRGGLHNWRQENLPLVKGDGKKVK